jgi:hypothetical protein
MLSFTTNIFRMKVVAIVFSCQEMKQNMRVKIVRQAHASIVTLNILGFVS